MTQCLVLRMDLAITQVACSVHPEIPKSTVLWKKIVHLESSRWSAKMPLSKQQAVSRWGAGESTGKCCTTHGLMPQLPAQFQYSGWLSRLHARKIWIMIAMKSYHLY